MKVTIDEKVKRLLSFVSGTDGMSDEEIKTELIGDGVDVDAFNERCFNIINKAKIKMLEKENKQLKEQIIRKLNKEV